LTFSGQDDVTIGLLAAILFLQYSIVTKDVTYFYPTRDWNTCQQLLASLTDAVLRPANKNDEGMLREDDIREHVGIEEKPL
jgi:hypothetical protein